MLLCRSASSTPISTSIIIPNTTKLSSAFSHCTEPSLIRSSTCATATVSLLYTLAISIIGSCCPEILLYFNPSFSGLGLSVAKVHCCHLLYEYEHLLEVLAYVFYVL